MINIFKKSYKYYQDKIYGIGLYKQLLEYSKDTKENIHTRIFLSPYMTSKDKNQQFFKELQFIQRKGIVAMIGTNGLRHTTLWNGNNFADVEFNYYNFLNETNYIIKELYFWDLL